MSDAITYLPAIVDRMAPARPVDAPVWTRAERVAQDFIMSFSNRSTRDNYTQGLRAWFGFCQRAGMDPFTGYDNEGVRRSDVEKFLRWSEEVDGKARRTCAHRFSAMRGFYRRAVMDGHIEKDPCVYVKAPVVERRTTSNYFTRGELATMLKLAKQRRARDFAIFCVLGYMGLRCGEVVSLDVASLGRDRGFTTITFTRKGGRVQTLSLSQETVWAVSEYLGDRTDGPLFQSLRTPGKRMNRGDVVALVHYYAKKAGITKRVTPHSFRHSFVTLSLNAGVSHRDVQISAGHADGRMTTYYDHGSDNRAREATHALTAFVNEML